VVDTVEEEIVVMVVTDLCFKQPATNVVTAVWFPLGLPVINQCTVVSALKRPIDLREGTEIMIVEIVIMEVGVMTAGVHPIVKCMMPFVTTAKKIVRFHSHLLLINLFTAIVALRIKNQVPEIIIDLPKLHKIFKVWKEKLMNWQVKWTYC
jgi:hypothetical protein